MKKLLIMCIAIISFSAAFAQDHHTTSRLNNNDQHYNQPMGNHKDIAYAGDQRSNHDNQWQHENGRAYAESADRRDDPDHYRNDRSLRSFESDRKVYITQQERNRHGSSIGKVVVAGAIAGLVAGVLFSH